MNVLIRKTIAGSEYWNTEEKRTMFVPRGQKPDFEVTEDPQSMITPEKQIAGSVDFGEVGKDISVNGNGSIIDDQAEALDSNELIIEELQGEESTQESSELESMSVKQLRDYAKKNNIEIPGAIRSKGDIVQVIQESIK